MAHQFLSATTPGANGVIDVDSIDRTSLELSWSKASDSIDQDTDLQYRVYYSENEMGDAVDEIKAQGTPYGSYAAIKDLDVKLDFNLGALPGAQGLSWGSTDNINGVTCTCVYGSDVYIGGYFTSVDGVSANRIAKWNGSSWSAVGSGLNNIPYSMVVADGVLYVSGTFTNAGGVAVNYVARWDGATWYAAGSGIPTWGYSLANVSGTVYVGARNNTYDGNLFRWNGSSWVNVSPTVNGSVYAIAAQGTDLLVGGDFYVNDGSFYCLARLVNQSYFVNLNARNSINSTCSISGIAVLGSEIYVSGANLASISGVAVAQLTRWNGSSWVSIPGWSGHPGGSSFSGNRIYADTTNNEVYIAGPYGSSPSLYCFTPSTNSLESIMTVSGSSSSFIRAMCMKDHILYIGGAFSSSPSAHTARYGDITAPSPYNTSSIDVSNIAGSSVTLTWQKADDYGRPQSSLQYLVYYSTGSFGSGSVAEIEANGTPFGSYTYDIATKTVTGLSGYTSYVFNVIVKDPVGNKNSYSTAYATTLDNTPPVPTNSNITATPISFVHAAVNVAWSNATDNKTYDYLLVYRIYASTNSAMDSVAQIEANGIKYYETGMMPGATTADYMVQLPQTNVTYYFNIIVLDSDGNKTAYTKASAIPPDLQVPTVTDSQLTITPQNGNILVSWTPATDSSGSAGLTYRVYYSSSTTSDVVFGIEQYMTAFGSAQAGITSKLVTGLTANTRYSFNVIVADVSNNKSCYVSGTGYTDIIPPTLPGDTQLFYNGGSLQHSPSTDTPAGYPATNLLYGIYTSSSSSMNSVAEIEANGTLLSGGFTQNGSGRYIKGLIPSNARYFNVIVKDIGENKVAYTMLDRPNQAPTLSSSNIDVVTSGTSITLTWNAAQDDYTLDSSLLYQVFYSLSNNLGSIANIEANGTPVGTYANVLTKTINLPNLGAVPYYFNVIVKDGSNSKTAYATRTVTNSAPTVTNSVITASNLNVGTGSVILSWNAATDDFTAQAQLQYRLYYSASPNLNTLAEVEANGTPVGNFTANLLTNTITGLTGLGTTPYYANVIVKDHFDTKSIYSQYVITDYPPRVTNGTITIANIDASSGEITVGWSVATDDFTAQNQLEYLVYYSLVPEMNTVAQIETNGIAIGSYAANILTSTFILPDFGRTEFVAYYINVLVKDMRGERNNYTKLNVSNNPPVVSNGVITLNNINTDLGQVQLAWNAASDDFTSQSNLQYLAYYSNNSNMDAVELVERNGTAVGTYASAITLKLITGLTALGSESYYFNVIVKDGVGKKSVYSKASLSDILPPTVANSIITVTDVKARQVALSWEKASDAKDNQLDLEYLVYYSQSVIGTLSQIDSNGIASGVFAKDITTTTVDTLTKNTAYNFNVVVRDTKGNRAIYAQKSQTTSSVDATTFNKKIVGLSPATQYYFNVLVKDTLGNEVSYKESIATTIDDIAPTPGGTGIILSSGVGLNSVTLSWSKGNDSTTSQENLRYAVYYSKSSYMDTGAEIKAHGTLVTSALDINTCVVTGLNSSTMYYFNVLISDQFDNESTYVKLAHGTLDVNGPIPSNLGLITTLGVTDTRVMLNWSRATDALTLQENLEYLAYYSLNPAMTTISDIETNGTPFEDYVSNINVKVITGLTSNGTYYFNVIVKDQAGNKNAYTQTQVTTLDSIPPIVGSSGLLAPTIVGATTITVAWNAATDNKTATEDLQYLLYYSQVSTMDTIADIKSYGTPVGSYTTNITTRQVTGLAPYTTYYFNVLVMDDAGNESSYSKLTQQTLDNVPPVVGNSGALSASNLSATQVGISWQKATDNLTAQADLDYLVYFSTSPNLASVFDIESNGTASGEYTKNIATKTVTGLSGSTLYYFNVIVKDAPGNKSAYSMLTQSTLDGVAPTPGNSGLLTATNVGATTTTINWTKATDDFSSQSALQYLAYYSLENNLDTVVNIETNGTAFDTWVTDISSVQIFPIASSTHYYFNVIVKDEAGNKAAYTTVNATTLDVTSPTPGNSGVISVLSSPTSVYLSWMVATDDISGASTLQYLAYYSLNSNMTSISDIETNGVAVGEYALDIGNKNITGLTSSTDYYFNVIVKDESGNKAAYIQKMAATSDITPPVVGDGTLTPTQVTDGSVTLSWGEATDNRDLQAQLQYRVYYSTNPDLTTVEDVETNGTPVGEYE
jgi:chitodextrinase